jgi:radical SAM superfamily enzyme YgiQ (UPF0313 family)
MYDAVLIASHYTYDDGRPRPSPDDAAFQDLSAIIPLGLVHLAQHLHDSGFNVRLVHLPQEIHTLYRLGLSAERLAEAVATVLARYPARVCALQAHFYLYTGGALHIADVYRRLFPESTILVGGYMATACWREFLSAAPAVDGVVLGEGEATLRRLVEAAPFRDRRLPAIDGLARRKADGTLVGRPVRMEDLLDLTQMPVIDPAAPPFKHLVWPPRSYINISRGVCPETCAYCVANSRTINARPFGTMAIDRILAQLARYQEAGIRGVFLGENHFLDLDFMQALIAEIIRADFDLYFELETHPLVFKDRHLLDKMIAAGFLRYTMGCESGSDRLLRRMGRHASTDQIMASVRQVAAAGGLVITSWICNLPGETEADFSATRTLLDRVVAAGGFVYWIENLHVLPGSPLHRHPEKWDIDLLLKDLNDWLRWSLHSKAFVEFEQARKVPQDYLTHLNRNTDPREMVARLYTLRRQARDLVPAMRTNLEARRSHLPPALAASERRTLDWYAERGWKLWLF